MRVVKIRFVKADPSADQGHDLGRDIVARVGHSLMSEAVSGGVTEIVAECGGVLTCGTCHVFVRAPDGVPFDPPGAEESELLSFTATPRRETSRLSCQLTVTPQMDGMIIELPAAQY